MDDEFAKELLKSSILTCLKGKFKESLDMIEKSEYKELPIFQVITLSVKRIIEEEEKLREELKSTTFPLKEVGQTCELPDGRLIGYKEYGRKEKEEEEEEEKVSGFVILIHGTPGSRFFFTAEMEEEVNRMKLRVFVIERPGFGLSSPHPTRTYQTFAQDTQIFINNVIKSNPQYIKDTSIPISLIGYSAGGPYAAACAHYIPDDLTAVSLVATPSPPENPKSTQGMEFTNKIGYFIAKHWRWGLETIGVAPEAKKWLKDPLKSTKEFLTQTGSLGDAKAFLLQPSIERAFSISSAEMYSQFRAAVETETRDYWLFSHSWGFSLSDCDKRLHYSVWYGLEDCSTVPEMNKFVVANLPRAVEHAFDDEGHLVFFTKWNEILQELHLVSHGKSALPEERGEIEDVSSIVVAEEPSNQSSSSSSTS